MKPRENGKVSFSLMGRTQLSWLAPSFVLSTALLLSACGGHRSPLTQEPEFRHIKIYMVPDGGRTRYLDVIDPARLGRPGWLVVAPQNESDYRIWDVPKDRPLPTVFIRGLDADLEQLWTCDCPVGGADGDTVIASPDPAPKRL